jgi:hypothetical protein
VRAYLGRPLLRSRHATYLLHDVASACHIKTGHIRIIAANAQRDLGNFRAAVASIKAAHDIYVAKFGEDDPRSKESLASYKMYAAEAVRVEKLRKLGVKAEIGKKLKPRTPPSPPLVAAATADESTKSSGRANAGKKKSKPKAKPAVKAESHPVNGKVGAKSIDEVMSFING